MEKESLIGKREIIFLLILAAVLLALRLPHMYDPLSREEGLYAYAADLTYSKDLPYKAVFDNTPPFIFYIYRAAFDLFGKSVEAIRNFTSTYVLFSMLLIYMLARTFGRASTAMMASFFYVIFLNNRFTQGFYSGPEMFTHFTVIFSLYFMLDRDKTYEKANFFLTGFLMSAAVFTSAVILPAAIIPVVYAMAYIKEKKSAGAGVLWYVFGFLTLVLLAVLWSVKNSIFREFFDAVFIYNLKETVIFVKTIDARSLFAGLGVFAGRNLLLSAGFLYSFAGLFIKKRDQLNFSLFFAVLAIIAGSMAGRHIQPHNYTVLMPYLSLLGALMIKDCMDAVNKMKTGGKAAALAGITVVLAGVFCSVYATGYFGNIMNAGEKDAVLSEARVLAVEINSMKTPSSSLFVWPNEPEIYFYTGIKAGQRFVAPADNRIYGDEYRKMLANVTEKPPELIVMEKGAGEILFEKLLKKDYSKSLEGKRFVLYKKGGPL